MKDPSKLQDKLVELLRHTPALNILPSYAHSWSELEFREVAWVVEDFVNQNQEVIECDPLKDWLEEYKFYKADSNSRNHVEETLRTHS